MSQEQTRPDNSSSSSSSSSVPSQSQSVHTSSNITRNQPRSTVKGPTSALTSFLQEHGISAREIARRYEAQLRAREEAIAQAHAATAAAISIASSESHAQSTSTVTVPSKRKLRKKKHLPSSDDESEDENESAKKKPASSSSSSSSSSNPSQLQPLCNRCNQPLPLSLMCTCSKPKTQKRKQELEFTSETVVPSLQDFCVRTLVRHLEFIDELGDLPDTSRVKLARALSKRRLLSEAILPMFLSPHLSSLTLFDITLITPKELVLLPTATPFLKQLHLGFCGRVNDFVLQAWSQWSLLQEIHLSGVYLISDRAWADFFQQRGHQLTKLELAHPSKLSQLGIEALVQAQKKDGFKLNHLALIHGDALTSSCFQFLSNLSLSTLDLRHSCSNLTFTLLLLFLKQTLHQLALTQMTWDQSQFLLSCPFTQLTLQDITSPSLDSQSKVVPYTLQSLVMDRCTFSPTPWLMSSKHTLTFLSIQALPLTSDLIQLIHECHQLRELDVSWVREVNDSILKQWVQPNLKKIILFGCHLITPILIKQGLKNSLGEPIALIGSEYTV